MNNLVAIAGAGPAGLMLACELRTAGVPTVVFDPLPEPRRAAPGVAINPAVVELLDQRGVMDALRADGMEFRQAFFAHLALDPTKLPEERAYNFAVPQQQVERRLEEHALKLGADIRRGYRITDLEQDEEGVTLTVADPEGARHTERCGYLAGCDGAGSTVRELVNVGFPGQDSPFYGIVADLDMTEELFPHLGARQYDEGLFTVTPTGPATLRVMTGELGRTLRTRTPSRRRRSCGSARGTSPVPTSRWRARTGSPAGSTSPGSRTATGRAGSSWWARPRMCTSRWAARR